MTSIRKFNYVVDRSHALLRMAHQAEPFLSGLCPVLVGKLRAAADEQSNARLFVAMRRFAESLTVGSILASLAGDALPQEARQEMAEQRLFLTIAMEALSRRYQSGTLEPELHEGGQASAEFAQRQLALETDSVASPVNQASDGIA